MNVACGKNINCVVVKSGTLYTWGKGEHEKPKFDDYIEYSSPFPMIEDKHIVYVSCGAFHVMTLDINGRLYGWGEGSEGCLGLGDGKRRLSVCPISFFENKRCIDVSCGDRFTVVIAEVYPDLEGSDNDTFRRKGTVDLASGLINKLRNQ
jgi:alpha-tubulin suppressor-like RCC1 family protein